MFGLFSASLNFNVIKCVRFMTTHKVFVYGTLKRNEPNNHWLTDKSKGISQFIGTGVTTVKYPLIIATRYNIPFLLYSPGKGEFVQGEVYEVDDKMLSNLDILEDHPNYYVREIDDIKVKKSSNKEELIKCWVYFLKNFKQELLSMPTMASYTSRGPHGREYTERSKRDLKYQHEVTDLKTKVSLCVQKITTLTSDNESTIDDLNDDVLQKK